MDVVELNGYATCIRENVRMVMNHKGITNQQIADRLGLSLSQVQDRTTLKTQGKQKANWSAPELAAVADVLDVPVLVFYLTPDEAWQWIAGQGIMPMLRKRHFSCKYVTAGQRPVPVRNADFDRKSA